MLIIPQPQKIQIFEEKIKATSFCVTADNKEIYKFLKADGNFKLEFKNDSSLLDEHYKISVTKEKIKITYGTLEGAYRAYTTLKQIISQSENGEIPCLEIEDYPVLKNRGYMLELKEELKKVKADETAVREIENNCDMVIFFAGLLSGEKNDYTKDAEKLIFEYEALWDMKNKSVGKEIFIKSVNKALEKFKNL